MSEGRKLRELISRKPEIPMWSHSANMWIYKGEQIIDGAIADHRWLQDLSRWADEVEALAEAALRAETPTCEATIDFEPLLRGELKQTQTFHNQAEGSQLAGRLSDASHVERTLSEQTLIAALHKLQFENEIRLDEAHRWNANRVHHVGTPVKGEWGYNRITALEQQHADIFLKSDEPASENNRNDTMEYWRSRAITAEHKVLEFHAQIAGQPRVETPAPREPWADINWDRLPVRWRQINGVRVDAETIAKWFFQVDDKRQRELEWLVEAACGVAQRVAAGEPE